MQMVIPFRTIGQRNFVPSGTYGWAAYLNRAAWDDWSSYCTQFYLTVVDADGVQHGVGQVKIGQRGLKPHGSALNLPDGYRKPSVPTTFEQLDEAFFSVGQDEDYYAKLVELGHAVREQVLTCLRDVAFDSERWQWAKDEDVMIGSLLRSVTSSTVQGQFRRMAQHGDARLTKFRFTYSPPKRLGEGAPPFRLDLSLIRSPLSQLMFTCSSAEMVWERHDCCL
jgi:hypothetical protein